MNLDLDSTTIIAGVLGFFFLIVAMFKNFGRRNSNQLYIPGTPKPQNDEQEVKLSDPFSSPKTGEKASSNAAKQPASPAPAILDKSSFKQFAPDSSFVSDVKVRNDTDYQWE